MSDDLRAIAERSMEPGQNDFSEVCIAAYSLAAAYLAEHPADDDTPIDHEWLAAVGGVQEDHPAKVTFHRDDALLIGLWLVPDGWKAMLIHGVSAASCIVRGLRTRRDVRLLCRALGVTLKEGE